MATKPSRPKNPTMRKWLVKFKGVSEPVEVEAEYRDAAKHYSKSMVDHIPMEHFKNHYVLVEWTRLKRT